MMSISSDGLGKTIIHPFAPIYKRWRTHLRHFPSHEADPTRLSSISMPTQYCATRHDGDLTRELSIHRFNDKTRTKAHLFAVNGALGEQFAIVLGDTDVRTGHHPALQTQILLERCSVPVMEGVEPTPTPYNGSRIKKKQDSKLAALVRQNK